MIQRDNPEEPGTHLSYDDDPGDPLLDMVRSTARNAKPNPQQGQDLPALPGEIDPNEPVVSFRMTSCRKCPEHFGAWVRDDHGEGEELYDWQHEHGKSTGHRSFYMWTLSRNTAKTFNL